MAEEMMGGASGFTTCITDWLAKTIVLADSRHAIAAELNPQIQWEGDAKLFPLSSFRLVSRQPGFWSKIFSDIPSCTTFVAANADTLSVSEIRDLCAGIASHQCTFRTLMLHGLEYGSNEDNSKAILSFLWPALLQNTSVDSLSIISRYGAGHNLFSMLTQAHCSLTSLTLYITPEIIRFADLHLAAVFNGLAQNTISLTSLCIHSVCSHRNHSPPLELGKMLSTNTSLTSLQLRNCHVPTNVFRELFSSLAKNRHLQILSLAECDGAWPSAVVLDSLQTNGIFHKLDLHGTPLQYIAAISVQLARNLENAEQVNLLQSASTPISVESTAMHTAANQDGADEFNMVKPTAVRLFLCGLPYSGKTTLSRSFVTFTKKNRNSGLSWRGIGSSGKKRFPWAKGSMVERTRGIEITTLEEGDLKVSLWDLAGQAEYYTFHDYMFPNLSSRGTPGFFLFVWNPIEVTEKGQHKKQYNGAFVKKSVKKFEKEFTYWLRFIASKTLKSEKFKPRLIVVITRKDCGLKHIKSSIYDAFQKLQHTFKDTVRFDADGLFEIDARDAMQLEGLANYVFYCARDILDSAPKVHAACKDAKSMIANLVDTKRIPPLITREKFLSLCKKHLKINSEKAQEAIALSLNDSGDLIYFASLQFVVVDTNWFCHHVMGDLMSKTIETQCSGDRNSQGIFSVKFLEVLLEAQMNSLASSESSQIRQPSKADGRNLMTHAKVGGEDLLKLLVELQLACRVNEDGGNSDVFIPASLSQKSPPQFRVIREFSKAYIGRRLKCKDTKCTFLTPGVFPLLQVVFHSSIKTTSADESVVMLEEDVISYAEEGCGVIIELFKQQGEEHFIDVLICSHLMLAQTIKWVHKKVITIIERVCAQPKGIQGVELEHEVIRPECVEGIVPIEKRTQSVSVKYLKERLEKHLREEGFGADGFKNVLHTWIPGGNSHRVDELLGEETTKKIVEAYWRGLSVAAADALGVVQKDIGKENFGGKEQPDICSKLDEVLTRMDKLQKEMQNHGKKIDNLRKAVIPKLEDLFTFFKEGEAKLPRMLVVSKGHSGWAHNMAAAMVPMLSSSRLELLCECNCGPHRVKEHPGIDIATLNDGLLKQGLPYINTFLKVANVALKVGAHVAIGLGNMVPDFQHVLALIEDTNEFPGFPTISDPADSLCTTSFASRKNFQEGQLWLREVLSSRSYLSDIQIKKVFGLIRIRYPNHKVAWVCKEHAHAGLLCPAWS